jgi:hypothetical protein
VAGEVDEALDDEEIVGEVMTVMRRRRPQSARRGRTGTPADVVLRMLALKHLRDWSYDDLEREVTGSLVYRRFCRIDAAKVPDAKTMVRLGQVMDGPTLQHLLHRLVMIATTTGVTKGKKIRVDTEVPRRAPLPNLLPASGEKGSEWLRRPAEPNFGAGSGAPRALSAPPVSLEAQSGREHLARQPAVRRAVERAGRVEAGADAAVASGRAGSPATAARAASPSPVPAPRPAVFGRGLAAAASARPGEGREQRQRAQPTAGSHQYFTQISSFAASAVSAVTPAVAAISSAVVGFAL